MGVFSALFSWHFRTKSASMKPHHDLQRKCKACINKSHPTTATRTTSEWWRIFAETAEGKLRKSRKAGNSSSILMDNEIIYKKLKRSVEKSIICNERTNKSKRNWNRLITRKMTGKYNHRKEGNCTHLQITILAFLRQNCHSQKTLWTLGKLKSNERKPQCLQSRLKKRIKSA